MSLPQIVCENCGAKYRLPDSFQGEKAKCKACGNVIDVTAQRKAAEEPADKPAAARPAKARPAVERPAKDRPARAERGSAVSGRRSRRGAEAAAGDDEPKAGRTGRRGAAAGRRGRRVAEADDDEGGARRGRAARGEKKDNKAVLIGSAIGVVAVLIVVVIFLMGGNGDDQPGTTETAQNQEQTGGDATEDTGDSGAAADAQEADAQKSQGGQATEGAMPSGGQPGEEQPASQPEEQPDEDPAPAPEAEPDVDPDAPAWMKSDVTSPDQVFDPEAETEPVEWPDYVTAEEKAKVTELLDEVQYGGAKAPHAKKELEEMGHKAIAGIVNRLREINYLDSWESMYAWELNKILEAMTIGMNVGFVAIEIGEDIDPRKADWNAKTAKAWQKLLDLYPTPEKFQGLLRARKTRHNK